MDTMSLVEMRATALETMEMLEPMLKRHAFAEVDTFLANMVYHLDRYSGSALLMTLYATSDYQEHLPAWPALVAAVAPTLSGWYHALHEFEK